MATVFASLLFAWSHQASYALTAVPAAVSPLFERVCFFSGGPHRVYLAFSVSLPQSRSFPRTCSPCSVVVCSGRSASLRKGSREASASGLSSPQERAALRRGSAGSPCVPSRRSMLPNPYSWATLGSSPGASGEQPVPHKGEYPQVPVARRDFRKPSLKGLT